ncbi:MAG: UDP-N-acetylglucosamine 4,6-dehydratase (inverting) [Desulfomonilaceae bacterium]
MSLDGKIILITGGTGSFGKKFVELTLKNYSPKKLIVFSRDEFKQHQMATSGFDHEAMRYFIGDVRDKDRLCRALDGVDYVIHAAALKQIPACEYNPIEAVKTNVLGAANLIDAAIERNVKKVLAISTDKAVAPVNLYGATKLCSDKLFVAGNSYSGVHVTRFSVVRYGNVIGSRGSVIPLFSKLARSGTLPVTDTRMTRFWLTLDQGVLFVLKSLERMEGGEIFVPKIPSMNILDLAEALAPGCSTNTIGIRPGEKLHEVLIPKDDARYTVEHDDSFVIFSGIKKGLMENYLAKYGGALCQEGFSYSSDTNTRWLSVPELRNILEDCEGQPE